MGNNLIEFNARNSKVSEEKLRDLEDRLRPEVQNMREATEKGYNDPRASINLPGDEETLKQVKKLVKDKRRLNPEYLVVAGIGGSNLGTIAVQEAVLGKLYNQKNPDTKILYAETTDSEHIGDILDIIESSLERGETVLLNGVSKSGGTTETISNFEIIAEKISEYKNKPEEYITVTSQKTHRFISWQRRKTTPRLRYLRRLGVVTLSSPP
jgi:Glucose-6-phosphate isomerase